MNDIERMRALKNQGASLRQIGDMFNMSGTAVFYKLGGKKTPTVKQVVNEDPATSFLNEDRLIPNSVRKFRTTRMRKLIAANDNNPDRITRMTPYNGGCSTTSGMVPVTLARVATIEAAEVPMSAREMANGMAVAA